MKHIVLVYSNERVNKLYARELEICARMTGCGWVGTGVDMLFTYQTYPQVLLSRYTS